MDCPQTYWERLDTFEKYPWDCAISCEDMARAGFYINPRAPKKTRCFSCKINIDDWSDDDDPVAEHLRISPECAWIRVLGDPTHTVQDRFDTFEGWPYSSDSALSALKMAEAGFFYNPRFWGDDTAECAFCQVCFNEWNADDAPLEVHQTQRSDCAYMVQMRQHCEVPVPDLAPSDLGSSLLSLSEEEHSGFARQLEPVMDQTGAEEQEQQEASASHSASSMVTVDAEERSVDSGRVSNNENDPETPQSMGDAPDPAPPLSILRSTFTSTPFERAAPNRLLSHPMPSPLPDLGRQSFEVSHSRISPVMYPRLPSFPREPSSPTPNKMEYLCDNSTPSPQRHAVKVLRESHSEGSSLASLPSMASLASFEPLPVRVQAPTIQELASEFEDCLPRSSLEFLYSVRDQTVAEWQALLADEVCKQVRRVTAQAVERLEVERTRVIAQVRAQCSK